MEEDSFKFDLYKKNNKYEQHNNIVKANNKFLCGYFVPLFVSYDDLYNYYHNNKILEKSILLIPNIRINDSKYHYINYDCYNAFQHSESKEKCNMKNLSDLKIIFSDIELIDKNTMFLSLGDEIKSNEEFDRFLIRTNTILFLK